MPSRTLFCQKLGLIAPPPYLVDNLHLEAVMGSVAYGCNSPDKSDFDIRGVFAPPKAHCFPGLQGLVVGFDDVPEHKAWQKAHVNDAARGREFDFELHPITKFLKLCAMNNPDQMGLLFSRESNITHCSAVGRMLLDARRIFPSKLLWKRFRGYAADQFHRLKKEGVPEGKRKELVQKYGYDVKFAYHCIRLLNQARQLLVAGEMDLMDGQEEYKAIRRGDWSFARLEQEFEARKLQVESVFLTTALPETPDAAVVRQLLLDCLEHHYGSLAKAVTRPDELAIALRDIDATLARVREKL